MPDQTPATGGHAPYEDEPLPYSRDKNLIHLYDDNNNVIAELYCSDQTADFIVAACNSHCPLLAALKDVERRMLLRTDREKNLPSDLREILAIVRKAIASAEGGAA